ncbi:MAG: PQQ-dependent sugar dehydrogenase [Pseudomonadota bacterium]
MKLFTASALIALAACSASTPAVSQRAPFTVTTVADFDAPWAMTFLPDGRMLVTEKQGQLKLVSADAKAVTVVSGTPTVDYAGQGALMDVVLHPDFGQNRIVYLSWSEAGEGGKGVALGRGKLVEKQVQCIRAPCPPVAELQGFETIFRARPFVTGNGHYSGRIVFSPDKQFLFFANGERQKFDPAQDKSMTLGKLLRLTPDGKPAPGNPLVKDGFQPEVWSYGHRNILGLAFDAAGNLWEQEMGPKGGDEVNLILPGRNYGYPLVSDGDHYDGKLIPRHSTRPDLEAPKVSWNPVISPGGLIIYSGKMFPQWKGDAFIGGLSSEALVRVDINGTTASKGDQWPMGARIREVEEGPDGAIWLLEDGGRGSQGRLLKLTPAK